MAGRRYVLKRILVLSVQAVCLIFLLVSTAYAESQAPSTRNIGGPLFGASIAALICYKARKRAIGGWLLYYYIQLYGGTLILGIISLASISNYYPQNWADKPLYTLYLLSTIPTDITNIFEIIVASFLLSKRFRNSSTVNILRVVFVLAFIFSIIGIFIDLAHWKESVPFDILGILWPGIWFFYFTFSKRVDSVFRRTDWDYSSFSAQDQLAGEMDQAKFILSPEQVKKYRKKATLYIVVSILVLIFGTLLISKLDQSYKGLQTIVAIIVMAWGMGWYSISKGYSRSLGLLLGLLSWIGLIILYFLEDKNKPVTT
jgi:hypothetical protein